MATTLHIRLLGRPEFRMGNRPVQLETTKTLALLAYIAARPGLHSREILAALFWGEQDQARAARSLRRALWNIRRSLCGGRGEKSCPYLTVTRREVAFDHDSPHTLDTKLFTEHLDAARRILSSSSDRTPIAAQEIRHLTACESLYRGDFMDGIYISDSPTFETWLLGERAYYRERILEVLSRLSEIHMTRGEYRDAILVLQRLLTVDPWSEWAHRQLMLCYALAGRRTDALAQYQRCREILRKELNAEPSPKTVHLYERIRDPRHFASLSSQAGAEPTRQDHDWPPIPFTGRGREHAWLLEQWKQSESPLTLVEGDPGVGKTSLVEEVLRYLSGRGVPALCGRCYPFGSAIPFHPIADALRSALNRNPQGLSSLATIWLVELSRLLPELADMYPDLPPPVPIERSALARRRLFEAVAQFLTALNDGGIVLFLDDMHWADPDTVDMLRYLFHRLREERIWFVAAYRVGEMESGHPFRLLRRDLGRLNRVRSLHLRPLQKEVVQEIVSRWPGLLTEDARLLGEYLYADSQGNPFMFIELVRDVVDRGLLRREGDGWTVDVRWLQKAVRVSTRRLLVLHDSSRRVPPTVRQMILSRVERLPDLSQRVLRFAAALGEPFTRDTLHRIADVPPRDVDMALATWVSRGLVSALSRDPAPRYDFTHPLIRQAVYACLSQADRQAIHERIARALERLYAGREESIVETLAYHYGESAHAEKAVRYLLQAGERAQARQAQDAAIHFYTRALGLIPDDDMERRYQALSGRERAYHRLARRDEQARDLDALWQLAHAQGDPIRQAEVLLRRAEWAMRTARFREGIGHARDAHRLAVEGGDFGIAVDARRVESKCLVRMGEMEKARDSCMDGLRLAQKVGDRRREMLCLGSLGVVELDMDRLEEARKHMEAALDYWRQTEEVWRRAIVCNNLSMLYHRLGDYGRAMELQREARSLIPRTGDLGLDAYSRTSQGILYHTIGRYEDALKCYRHALELARIISDRSLESYIHSCRGETYLALNDVNAAEQAYREALSIEEEMGVNFYRPQIWEGLAGCALAQGDVEEARRRLHEAETCYESSRLPGHTTTLAFLAYVNALLEDEAQSRKWLERFEAEASSMAASGDTLDTDVRWLVVQAWKALGDEAEAEEELRRLHELVRQRAATLSAEDRASYLTRVPAHRAVLDASQHMEM